jgi:predicted transcriptional regulator
MKNVTITLADDLARRARIEAARAEKSLSRWIGEAVEREIANAESQRAGLDALFALPLMPLSENGRLPPHSEHHSREILRRHKRDRLQPRSKRAAKA